MDVLARREVVFFIIFFMAHLRNETLNELPNLVFQTDCLACSIRNNNRTPCVMLERSYILHNKIERTTLA
jgi:hypothetical protein